jgi:hypothetical protein
LKGEGAGEKGGAFALALEAWILLRLRGPMSVGELAGALLGLKGYAYSRYGEGREYKDSRRALERTLCNCMHRLKSGKYVLDVMDEEQARRYKSVRGREPGCPEFVKWRALDGPFPLRVLGEGRPEELLEHSRQVAAGLVLVSESYGGLLCNDERRFVEKVLGSPLPPWVECGEIVPGEYEEFANSHLKTMENDGVYAAVEEARRKREEMERRREELLDLIKNELLKVREHAPRGMDPDRWAGELHRLLLLKDSADMEEALELVPQGTSSSPGGEEVVKKLVLEISRNQAVREGVEEFRKARSSWWEAMEKADGELRRLIAMVQAGTPLEGRCSACSVIFQRCDSNGRKL